MKPITYALALSANVFYSATLSAQQEPPVKPSQS